MAVTRRSIYVTGHRGLVGAAVVRRIREPHDLHMVSGRGPDLREYGALSRYFRDLPIDTVIHCAGRVGGIGANEAMPFDFLSDNLRMGLAVVHAAIDAGVGTLVNLGSSCIYPRDAEQPLRESALLTGPLEQTNEAYALAKIAVLKLCQYAHGRDGRRYISAMPTNLYGPGDRYDLYGSHVVPAMILKFDRARRAGSSSVMLWGTGRPLRELLFVDDLADAIAVLLDSYHDAEPINIGSGHEIQISELALLVAKAVGFTGRIEWDLSRPDGTPRKLLDSTKIRALGWAPKIGLEEGLARAVEDFHRRGLI